ncbi:hypothetical protein [uncultured Massilia sp.]|uniref:hypothetical protein n=1 Tax=uncultured Massilia sp. TaxID=169973 RepID=UPI0025FD866A|nr:hypothetical protein [uncultured Massilia sp.]
MKTLVFALSMTVVTILFGLAVFESEAIIRWWFLLSSERRGFYQGGVTLIAIFLLIVMAVRDKTVSK